MLLVAIEMVKEMYIVATLQPIIFWISIYLFYPGYGLITFGLFKFITIVLAEIFYLSILFKKINLNLQILFNKIIKPLLIPVLVLLLILYLFYNDFPYSKSKSNLFYISSVGLGALITSCITLYFTSNDFKFSVNKVIKRK